MNVPIRVIQTVQIRMIQAVLMVVKVMRMTPLNWTFLSARGGYRSTTSEHFPWFGAVASHSTIFAVCYFRVVVSGRHMQITFCIFAYFIFHFQVSIF
jgi:hypothetical protein